MGNCLVDHFFALNPNEKCSDKWVLVVLVSTDYSIMVALLYVKNICLCVEICHVEN